MYFQNKWFLLIEGKHADVIGAVITSCIQENKEKYNDAHDYKPDIANVKFSRKIINCFTDIILFPSKGGKYDNIVIWQES